MFEPSGGRRAAGEEPREARAEQMFEPSGGRRAAGEEPREARAELRGGGTRAGRDTPASGTPEAGWTRGEREEASGPERALVVGAQPLQLLGIKAHAQGEPHLAQDGLDLVQGL